VTEIRPRTWYVDLTRAQWKDFYAVLSKLVIADGIVFDVRGYPTDSGFSLLPSLVAQPDHDTWMHVPTIVGPFYQVGAWRSFSWNVQPRSPRLVSPIVVLTDERAISYAESVLGHVADHQLATIIGGVTAGANGNIVRFTVPGQFMFIFTGMRVTGHDGSRQHHGVGITPDIALEPSLESIAAGRDDLLERALAVLAARKR
jgi:hypothetical protein